MKLNKTLEKDLKDLNIDLKKGATPKELKALLEKVNSSYENKELFDSVLDHTPCTVSWINKDLKYEGVNEKLATMMDKNKQDFVGVGLGDITKDTRFLNFSQKLFASDQDSMSDNVQSVINGIHKHYYVVGKKYDRGEKAVVIGMDVTELKEIEETTIFNEKLKTLGEMSATIIHEINNPLTAINFTSYMISDLVKKSPLNIKEIEKQTASIETTVQTISKIISNLKKFSRNTVKEELSEVSVVDVIKSASLVSKGKAKQEKVSIKLEEIDDVKIKANEIQIYQVLVNLMNNSVDAIKDQKDKWIKISAKEKDDNVEIKVMDSGNGIDDELAKKIFNPFFSTKPLGVGTGIGLDISNKIVKKHNGSISLDQDCKNTCFVISLPISK